MSVTGLSVRLRQAAPIPLDADFACAPGEILALVGPSGSGKSTILRAIAGTYRPREGAVSVDGAVWLDSSRGINVPPHRRAVGMVFQSYALFPHMTAARNVMAAMAHVARDERRRRADEVLDLVHLGGLEERRPAELSGGQQQRVAVARALAREPKVLLLDEPFSAVDRSTRQILYGEIAELRRVLNMPVVLVTHDLDEAMMLADRMTVLQRGRTLQTGTPEEVATKPLSREVAKLVNLRNVFEGRVAGRRPENGRVLIDWADLRLEAAPDDRPSPNEAVIWVIPEGFVDLHLQGHHAHGEQRNLVPGAIEAVLTAGQAAHVSMRPRHAPECLIHFSMPLRQARSNGIVPGAETTVSLVVEGIHLIPADGKNA